MTGKKLSRTRPMILVEPALRAAPGSSAEDLALDTGVKLKTVEGILRRLRALPPGHEMRVRVRKYARVGGRGPLSAFYQFHPTMPDAKRPPKTPMAQHNKARWVKTKALSSVTRNGARSTLAQGGKNGIWAGLLNA